MFSSTRRPHSLRLAERIASARLERLGEPQVKRLEGKLWALRLTGRDGDDIISAEVGRHGR